MSRAKCTVGPYTRESNEIVAPNGETLGVAYQMEVAGDAPRHCEETLANAAMFTASWQMLQALRSACRHILRSELALGKLNGAEEVKREIMDAIAAAGDS